jgi:predicted GNAT family N-acyltransferase
MPVSVFEVEHSTNMKNALVKFVELQDFRIGMIIVADESRKKQYEQTIMLNAFVPIKKYVYFWSYQQLSQLHSKSFELKVIKDTMREEGQWQPN